MEDSGETIQQLSERTSVRWPILTWLVLDNLCYGESMGMVPENWATLVEKIPPRQLDLFEQAAQLLGRNKAMEIVTGGGMPPQDHWQKPLAEVAMHRLADALVGMEDQALDDAWWL